LGRRGGGGIEGEAKKENNSLKVEVSGSFSRSLKALAPKTFSYPWVMTWLFEDRGGEIPVTKDWGQTGEEKAY